MGSPPQAGRRESGSLLVTWPEPEAGPVRPGLLSCVENALFRAGVGVRLQASCLWFSSHMGFLCLEHGVPLPPPAEPQGAPRGRPVTY